MSAVPSTAPTVSSDATSEALHASSGHATHQGSQRDVNMVSPSRQLNSVGTQHDSQSYAQWFYSEVRPLTVPHALPPVDVGTESGSSRKKRHSGAARTPRHTDPQKDPEDGADGPHATVGVVVGKNDFTPDRHMPVRRELSEEDGDRTDSSTSPRDPQEETTESSETSSGLDCALPPQEEVPPALLLENNEGRSCPTQPFAVGEESVDVAGNKLGTPADDKESSTSLAGSHGVAAMSTLPGGGVHTQQSSSSNAQQVATFVANAICSASLAAELEAYAVLRLQLRQDEQRDRKRYISLIERVIQNVLGRKATVVVHGSFATSLALQSSDIDVLVSNYEPLQPLVAIERVANALFGLESYDVPDLTLNVPNIPTPTTLTATAPYSDGALEADVEFPTDPNVVRQRSSTGNEVAGTSPTATPSCTPTTASPALFGGAGGGLFDPSASLVRHGAILSVQTIVATRVPVIKVSEILTGHKCDISFGGGEHFPSMNLTTQLLRDHPSARSLLLLMKYFIKKMQIGESEPGGITSFPLYLLAVHFYQHGLAAVHAVRQQKALGSPAAVMAPSNLPLSAQTSLLPPQQLGASPTGQSDSSALAAERNKVQETLESAFDHSTSHNVRIADIVGGFLYGEGGSNVAPTAGTSTTTTTATRRSPEQHAVQAVPSIDVGLPLPVSSVRPIEACLSVGQVVLDFCLYYAYLFEYDRWGIRFAPDGTSTVIEKPPQCNARGQHLHMTSPFDARYDITSRMAHTRELQAVCVGIASTLSSGSLAHLLAWMSPDTISDDLGVVYQYLQQVLPHLYHTQPQHHHNGMPNHHNSTGSHHGSSIGGYHRNQRHHSHNNPHSGVGQAQVQQGHHSNNNSMGQGQQQQQGAMNSSPITAGQHLQVMVGSRQRHYAMVHPPPGANQMQQQQDHMLGMMVDPNTQVRQPAFPGASSGPSPYASNTAVGSSNPMLNTAAPPYIAPPQGQAQDAIPYGGVPPPLASGAVTTGTMTTVPQAPPVQPPPLHVVAGGGTSGRSNAPYQSQMSGVGFRNSGDPTYHVAAAAAYLSNPAAGGGVNHNLPYHATTGTPPTHAISPPAPFNAALIGGAVQRGKLHGMNQPTSYAASSGGHNGGVVQQPVQQPLPSNVPPQQEVGRPATPEPSRLSPSAKNTTPSKAPIVTSAAPTTPNRTALDTPGPTSTAATGSSSSTVSTTQQTAAPEGSAQGAARRSQKARRATSKDAANKTPSVTVDVGAAPSNSNTSRSGTPATPSAVVQSTSSEQAESTQQTPAAKKKNKKKARGAGAAAASSVPPSAEATSKPPQGQREPPATTLSSSSAHDAAGSHAQPHHTTVTSNVSVAHPPAPSATVAAEPRAKYVPPFRRLLDESKQSGHEPM